MTIKGAAAMTIKASKDIAKELNCKKRFPIVTKNEHMDMKRKENMTCAKQTLGEDGDDEDDGARSTWRCER